MASLCRPVPPHRPGIKGPQPRPDPEPRAAVFLTGQGAPPRREGKGAARKAWEKINPNAELFEKIMTAVQNNLDHNPQWQKQNGQFIPHPATWLNQGRWDDDIDSVVHEDWLTREIREQGGLTF